MSFQKKTVLLLYSVNVFVDAAIVDVAYMILLILVSFAATYYFVFLALENKPDSEIQCFLADCNGN